MCSFTNELAQFSLNKTVTSTGPYVLNSTISYNVTATNNGTTGTLTNVVISDPKLTPNQKTCASVAPGATCVLSGTYNVTQADVDAGTVNNTANAISNEMLSAVTTSKSTSIAQSPALSIAKTVTSSGPYVLGSTIDYTVTATNSGTVTLTNVVVSDAQLSPNQNTCASVALGATCVLTGSHTVTQSDVNAGQVVIVRFQLKFLHRLLIQ